MRRVHNRVLTIVWLDSTSQNLEKKERQLQYQICNLKTARDEKGGLGFRFVTSSDLQERESRN